MSKALDFVKDFGDLLKANDEEQRRKSLLESELEEIRKEIETLKAKKIKLEEDIKIREEKFDKDLAEQKTNSDRIINQEFTRLDKLSERLEAQKIEQEKIEIQQKNKELSLTEKERLTDEKEIRLNHKEVDIGAKLVQNKKEQDDILIANMEIKKQLQNIEQELIKIDQAKKDEKDLTDAILRRQRELQDLEISFKEKVKVLEKGNKKLTDERIIIQNDWAKIDKEKKGIETEKLILSKQRKDNTDREMAIKAMQVELDFKIAQFKRKYEKDNK
jgi:chromosome segregation ATPase